MADLEEFLKEIQDQLISLDQVGGIDGKVLVSSSLIDSKSDMCHCLNLTNSAHKKAKATDSPIHWQTFRTLRNQVVSAIR